jgi:hypothetical protein
VPSGSTAEDDALGPGLSERDREGSVFEARGRLLMDLDPIEGDRRLRHAATAGDDGGQDRDLVGDVGAVLRIADGQRQRRGLLVENGADLLVVGAAGVAGGEHDGVGSLPEGQREVQRDGSRRGRLVQARDLAAVHGDQDARHPLGVRDDAGEGHRLLLDAGLIRGRGEEDFEGRGLGDAHPGPAPATPGLSAGRTPGCRRALPSKKTVRASCAARRSHRSP